MDTEQALKTMKAFAAAGLTVTFKEMDNREKRYSVRLPDGSAWILTIAGETGGWQNAHYHVGLREYYVVVKGWISVAHTLDSGDNHFGLMVPDAGIELGSSPHNIYMSPYSVIHTLKYGKAEGNPDKKGNDWWPADELDLATKRFATEQAVLDASSLY